ncbi:hypothetical protein [Quadrisphaera granulorum]|uniref:hypothetical protein n=1 Tax=Quadrisphaera granulorum TaxID=317664 RepID=UPI000D6CF6D7|nr:hypothetical protein [Quadrisphaera granulorum]
MTRVELTTVDGGGAEALAGEAKVLLEAAELVLRAPFRRRFATAQITDVVVDGDVLRLRCGPDEVALHLGGRAAVSWAKAIATPPPSLRQKLGLADGARPLLVGDTDDAALLEALKGTTTTDRAAADLLVACVATADDLLAALDVHADGPPVPVWVVYPKGKGVMFGDAAVREVLRGRGFRDTKTCAVSDRLTATRYQLGGR